jgi:hypothetical protein
MEKGCSSREKDPFVRWLLLGIPVLFAAAAPLHFLYEWTGENLVAGLFAPVNESVWEHLKLAFWPILLWWGLGALLAGGKEGAFPGYAVSCAAAELICCLFIVAFYYTYTGAFGIESLALDILSLFLGLLLGILCAVRVYRGSPSAAAAALSVLLLLAMAGAFVGFTFRVPHIPLFREATGGTADVLPFSL